MTMKYFFYLSVLLSFILLSCNDDPEVTVPGDGIYDLYITGINESIKDFDFISINGRTQEVPDEVMNLTLIVHQENEVVYEVRYASYDPLNPVELPDTIRVPQLEEGDYTIIAVTADYWFDPYYQNSVFDSYLYSMGPIFYGYAEISVTEENQEMSIDMQNISAKVTLRLKEGQEFIGESLTLNFETYGDQRFDYERETWSSMPDYYGGFGLYIGKYYTYDPISYEPSWEMITEASAYVLPKTLDKFNLYYYDQQGFNVSRRANLDPDIELNAGDAIEFVVDLEALLTLSADGNDIFDWEPLEWNDLGEVTLP
jgi:hypothetical protein